MSLPVLEQLIPFIQSADSLPQLFSHVVKQWPDSVVYSQAQIISPERREWRAATYREVSRKIWRLAHYLASRGVKAGDRVAIISFTRPEWMLADLAILYLGATSVSIYQSISAMETGYILFDAGVSWIFAENEEQVQKLKELERSPCPIPATEERAAQTINLKLAPLVTFEAVEGYLSVADILANPSIPETEPTLPPGADVASLVYTSGTTGPPKGVVQTHKNHLANIWQAARTGLFAPDGDLFLFLPLAHSFARLIGYLGFLTPTALRFPAVADTRSSVLNASSVLRDLREEGAQVVPMVPRLLEKLMNGVLEKANAGGIGAGILALTISSHRQVYGSHRDAVAASIGPLIISVLTTPIARKIRRQLFGERFRHVVSGGAKLPVAVNEFFASLGIQIYEGYGLTETCVATNVNRVGQNKIGSVGPCLEQVQCRIAEDGEILFKGPNIARGYHGRTAATRAAWDSEGWFHTGDLGRLDDQGFLFITGRKKELIVTSGGKKVSPLMIEEKLTASPFISSAVVLGDGRPYCIALVMLDVPLVKQWAERRGIELAPVISDDSNVFAHISSEVAAVNEKLSRFETIKKFAIIDQELTIENGFLTPTFKVKRGMVEKKYASLIAALYDGAAPE